MPYLESVTLPERITAGEPFDVVLHLSAQRKQDVLQYMPIGTTYKPYDYIDTEFPLEITGPARLEYNLWTHFPTNSNIREEPEPGRHTIHIGALPAGVHHLIMPTASSRRWGGARVDSGDCMLEWLFTHVELVEKEIVLNVSEPD